ncbi:NUDIX hydrolase [Undibacter mobilis]|uniref:NUDIX hydrolase n=1 Tax=Undibacter mobilis TaxID=2292256 RepID=A0A371BBS2_9BRAD|nr:NUDIX hydrolase [Undibacter mobilis]RDV05024.1 NUDIX hydrolase [Undibacter mobilis]
MALAVVRKATDSLLLRTSGRIVSRQFGAIPYTVVKGQVVFLLVTSRGTGRWIFPKGDPMDGLPPSQVAAQEALEEAGIEGDVDPAPIGAYRAFKTVAFRRKVVEVEMYPLRVTQQMDEWPEKGRRHRHWAILPEARRLLSDARVADLAVRLNQRLRAGGLPAYPPIAHITR